MCEVKNIGISILTADCAPILFYDPIKKIIGCAHSGWKGALNGIVKNTVKKFNELNSKNQDLIVIVGPCIGKESYEVQKDFYLATAADIVADPSAPDAFVEGIMEGVEWIMSGGKWVQAFVEKSQDEIRRTRKAELETTKLRIFENFLKNI